MADQNCRVAYQCQWCGDSFHQVDDHHSMAPIRIYVDSKGRQFDSMYCKRMYHGGWGEVTGHGIQNIRD